MTRQYLRACSLIVSSIGGEGLDLSQLRIEFQTEQASKASPNTAQIRVWNLNPTTAQKIENEFTQVTLQAGYEGGDIGVIFSGSIVQLRRGRANATDTYVDISASDGDAAFNYGIVSTNIANGQTLQAQYDAIMASFAQYGVAPGYTPQGLLDQFESIRGKVLVGKAADWLTQLAETTGSRWSIQNGVVNIVPVGGYLPEEAVVLNSQTGLIGIPEQTVDGINVRCLINPRLKYNGRIQLNESTITQSQIDISINAVQANAFNPRVANDGFYRIIVCNHTGDTRGSDWYCDLVCVALDDAVTPSLLSRGLA